MKLKKLLLSKTALVEITNKDMPISLAFKFKKVMNEYNMVDDLYQEKIKEIYTDLGKSDEKTGDIKIEAEHVNEVNERIIKIEEEEVFEDFNININIKELIDANIDIKPTVLHDLDWLIIE